MDQEQDGLFAGFAAKALGRDYGYDESFISSRPESFAPAGAPKGPCPLDPRSLCKGWRNFLLRFALSS